MEKIPKLFVFHFDWSKVVDENLKHEIEFCYKKVVNL